ncbi:MAG TPA: type I DNA topoisomerase [Bacteroidales bacterium]|jgi:DNA topoisomerase-1|nr:type I DNA topoisomerase [Bacteroidales bacterium]OQB61322.1 MAG: DNA topoisomerase 1 [Bacteroidetes bacterium ADurb.Bin145]HOU02069.1 type I DNA topoisomerase [Bacteroidales bacterium]HQG62618.1 type I DNA topoisomerase [Bacteroidales bacterium]HQK68089.1 type I DNA topoisomerase [Bacteroidales bacterium]
MIENLVIVESPAKAKTIEKFLGKEFHVISSFGHIRDLSKKNLGIDIADDFKPDYEIPKEKIKVVNELRKAAAEAKTIWIASDEDREGEAIAWHLTGVLKLDPATTKRIVFHEITKDAITEAIRNPRSIDMNLVNSQQARRILDRLVGFEISPVLWRKVQPSLSAGRVQSVAVRLIVEREREIIAFKPESSFKVSAVFKADTEGNSSLIRADASKKFPDEKSAGEFLELCAAAAYKVTDVSVKPGTRSPAPPFTTSTLQQEAYRKLGFSVSQTMAVAQRLYEAGKITYMRTDSTNLSKLALAKSREVIISSFGEKYSRTRQFKTKSKGAQEAHEAIRPAYLDNQSIQGNQNEKKLYELIWKRTIASQMADAEIEKTTIGIDMSNSPVTFTATGEVIRFDGFLKVYSESSDQENNDEERYILPQVKKGMPLQYNIITATQKFTVPPPRYTEASLVKKLEELGIGRPSTYAPTISTIQNRGYISREDRPGEKRQVKILTLEKGKVTAVGKTEMAGKEKSKLFPQDIGMIVNDFLIENFSEIVDYHFTAEVEEQFDDIAEGKLKWTAMLRDFYGPFHKTVEKTLENSDRKKGIRLLGNHPETGEPVSVRMGRFGPVAQIGSSEEGNKPRFASLAKNQLIETITLEEALNLFRLPRSLGIHEGDEIIVGTGRFGPYIRYRSKFFSLKKGVDDPYSITFGRALELIAEKNESEKKKTIKDFGDILVLNGKYGPYLSKDKQNYRLPKGTDTEKLTKEDCISIIEKSSKTRNKS